MHFTNHCIKSSCNPIKPPKKRLPHRRFRKKITGLTKLTSPSEIRIVEYILEHRYKSTDLFLMTQGGIARNTKCTKSEVYRVFGALQEDGLIVRIRNGVWQIAQPLLDLSEANSK